MSPDLNWGDALEAHPEWAMRNKDGSVQFNGEEPRLFKTCMFSSYMDDYVPAIMREINSLYDVDCFYTNGWPPHWQPARVPLRDLQQAAGAWTLRHTGASSTTASSTSGRSTTPLPKRKSRTASSSPTSAAMCAAARISTASARSPPGSRPTTRAAPMTTRRSGDAALQGRVCNAVLDGKFAANVTAAYSTGRRDLAQCLQESRRSHDVAERNPASGMVPYYHFVGAETALAKIAAGRRLARITSAGPRNTMRISRPAAPSPISESSSGRARSFSIPGPAPCAHAHTCTRPRRAFTMRLLSGRFAFDFVHEDRLEPEHLSKYRALFCRISPC